MDPNANIEEQRRIVARVNRCVDAEHRGERCTSPFACKCKYDAARLVELVQALDGWLCSGGFLPRTWERK